MRVISPLALIAFYCTCNAKTSFFTLEKSNGEFKPIRSTEKESNFKRTFKPERVVSKSSSVIVEDTLAPVGPYARTASAEIEDFSNLFIEEDDIYIFKQLIGQSKRFLYKLVDDKPENYERPSGFDEGDFQQMTLSSQELTDGIHKQFKISLCKVNYIVIRNSLV